MNYDGDYWTDCFISSFTCTETCPPISNVIVNLSFSVEEDGRQFACPGEHVTITCEVKKSPYVRIAVEPFICGGDPLTFNTGSTVDSFGLTTSIQGNLEILQLDPRLGNFTVTLTVDSTNETNNTVIKCADQLDSQRMQMKTIIQSGKTK